MEVRAFTAIGATLLALCGLPQLFRAMRDPSSCRGLSYFFLWAWCLGEAFMLLGMLSIASWPVLLNYLGNFVITLYLIGSKKWRTP